MRQTKESWNNQLYSDTQMIYTMKYKKSHMKKNMSNQKGKPQEVKTCFSIESYKQITITSCNKLPDVTLFISTIAERGMKA